MPSKDPEKRAAQMKQLRARRLAAGRCVTCNAPLVSKWYCAKCLAKTNETSLKYTARVRRIVLDHYGNRCQCCGEAEPRFLTIDHINGGGKQHCLEIGNGNRGVGSRRIYRWLIQQGYPPGYRILCFNCNAGRQLNGGICPHELHR